MRQAGKVVKCAMERFVIASSCAALLAGCVQGPDYVKPEVAVPQAYRYAENGVAPDVATAQQAWWSGW